MRVFNIHIRVLDASIARVGELIDSLASQEDRLWPRQSWPRMQFNRPLEMEPWEDRPIRFGVEEYKRPEGQYSQSSDEHHNLMICYLEISLASKFVTIYQPSMIRDQIRIEMDSRYVGRRFYSPRILPT